MNNRASLFLSLVLLSTSACTPTGSDKKHLVRSLEWFTLQTKAEVRAKAERHEIRERLRAAGHYVCEEGDWPQRWESGCDSCACDVGEVGWCIDRLRCPAADWAPPRPPSPKVETDEIQMGKRLETLTRRTRAELRHKAHRHEIRERYRAAGALFCEEGEWPQEWWDGCQWCWCDLRSQVRSCEYGFECDPDVERKLREMEQPSSP
jgi:hypothetical protein